MASQFDFLAKAKPASLYKLLEKLPADEAAVVLTGLPHALAIQSLAFFPEHLQGSFLPMMREARNVPAQQREAVAGKIRTMLGAAKAAKEGKTAVISKENQPPPETASAPPRTAPIPIPSNLAPKSAAGSHALGQNAPVAKEKFAQPRPPEPAAPATAPSAAAPSQRKPAPQVAPGAAKSMSAGHNPYESAPPAKLPGHAEKVENPAPPSPLAGLGSKLKDVLNRAAASAAGQPRRESSAGSPAPAKSPKEPASGARPSTGKPVPWVPRTATTSPINGPALPGTPPPVSGDPFKSPLAKAGLLDLIGRAQERFMPKDTAARRPSASRGLPPRARAPGGKPGRPEPREGVMSLDEVGFNKTPRVIGPRPGGRAGGVVAPAADSGARRMDGKAILAAILREAGPEVRGSVQEDDPGLMRELRGRMFYFDDLIFTEDAALARVFTAAPAETAALALKFAAPALRKRVLAAVSPGRARALEESTGRAGFDAVEAAQKKVLHVALQLQAAGRILIDPRDPDLAGG